MSSLAVIGGRRIGDNAVFRVWAPDASAVDVVLFDERDRELQSHPLEAATAGYFSGGIADTNCRVLYRYRVNGGGTFPDPASSFQPMGVHGPSEALDLRSFAWSDGAWLGPDRDRLTIYELHVGTFSPEGTFDGVTARLPYLRDLGVDTIELMPIGDFPGRRNWGYDGVCMFAPARCYGTPAQLQRLVDTAHGLGLAVILDVVYNHFGPDGNYTEALSAAYRSESHQTPWGAALNFDGPGSRPVRDFFMANAMHWLEEYHFDGLRLDAVHAIIDDSPRHFLAELSQRIRASFPNRRIILIAEDHRNLSRVVRGPEAGGYDIDAVWADDFHHEVQRYLAGDHEAYYRDFRGDLTDLAMILNCGWLYCGQHSHHAGGPRGSDPTGLTPPRFVFCLQNHDQVGNRPFGDRLHHAIDAAAYRAASTVLLLAPQTPLLFMGQEWATSSPFLYFTDHNPELGKLVTQGRRNEFRHFSAFAKDETAQTIPDPQAVGTFHRSRLNWEEQIRSPHREVWNLYQSLLTLRRQETALQDRCFDQFQAIAWDADTLVMHYRENRAAILIVARLRGSGTFRSSDRPQKQSLNGASARIVLHTEDERFAVDPRPPKIVFASREHVIEFARSGAVVISLLS